MVWNSDCLNSACCILPFMLSKEPLRLCTIFVQILLIIWAGLCHILEYLQRKMIMAICLASQWHDIVGVQPLKEDNEWLLNLQRDDEWLL